MEYDKDKVDDMVLALLSLTMFDHDTGLRAWKGHSWEHLDRLYEKEYISNPQSKAKSVVVTEKGQQRSEELFKEFFGSEDEDESE